MEQYWKSSLISNPGTTFIEEKITQIKFSSLTNFCPVCDLYLHELLIIARYLSLQPVMWTIIQTVFVPYVNSHLGKGIPLPIVHGFTIQNGELLCSNSRIMVCSDVTYAASYSHNLNWLLPSLLKYTHAT